MEVRIGPNVNVDYIDNILLDSVGRLKVVPAEELRKLPIMELQIWGNRRGVYCFPTTELIDWLKKRIDGRRAIEICSGNGAIGRALNIPRTDSYMQTTPEMILVYQAMGQKPIQPPPDVEKFEANEAVDHFRPEVVIGSFVTQKYINGDEGPPKVGSSIYGVDELGMIEKVKEYICIGNDVTHAGKRLFKHQHVRYCFDWLFTRSFEQKQNVIFVWSN